MLFVLLHYLYSHWHSGNALFTHVQTSVKLLNINKSLYIFRSTMQDSGFIYQHISEKHNLFSIGMVNVNVGRDSSVGTGTRYGLNCPGIESRCGRDFSHPSIPALGPTQTPTQWVPSLALGKRPGRGVDHPLPSSADVKQRAELYLCSQFGPSWSVLEWIYGERECWLRSNSKRRVLTCFVAAFWNVPGRNEENKIKYYGVRSNGRDSKLYVQNEIW
jgi:hypothetical protein